MEILTKPNSIVIMKATLDFGVIHLNDDNPYGITFNLSVQECEVGEAQIQKGENFIC